MRLEKGAQDCNDDKAWKIWDNSFETRRRHTLASVLTFDVPPIEQHRHVLDTRRIVSVKIEN